MPTYAASSPPEFELWTSTTFIRDAREIGREYRYRAITLISACRTLVQAKNRTCSSYNELKSVLQVADEALYSAARTRKKTTNNADTKFMKAVEALSAYELKYYIRGRVAYMMAEAEAKDKSSSKILNRLIETSREEPTRAVDFILHKSLSNKNPIIVKQALSQSSDANEIMWNFSRFKGERRLTLKDNPHFYEKLPTSAEKYVGQFRINPIGTFRQKTISVLIDNPGLTGRVFLETAKVERIFVNVWVPKEAIIFRDVCGKLEGESIIGSVIKTTPNLWCFEEPPLPDVSPAWLLRPDRSSPPPIRAAMPITSSTGALLGDWREPILRMLRPQGANINIRFSDRPPTTLSSGYSGPSLSPLPPDSNSIISSPSSTRLSRPTLGIQIPEAPQGPQSPSSYRRPHSTPVTARPLAVEMSPRSQTSLSSLSPESPTPTGTGNATPLTGQALLDYSALDTPTLSLREPSLVDVRPSQSDTDTILTSPTSTIITL